MKKVLVFALAALMVLSLSATGLAAQTNVSFNDFDDVTALAEGEDIIDKPDVTADNYKDYFAGAYDSSTVTNKAELALADGKGIDGSKALSVKQNRGADRSNVGVNLYTEEPISIDGATYLVVWVDFTGVDFRKACFGVIGDNHVLYRTDERDGVADLKFFIQDGSDWKEMLHGDDGCFGTAQSSSVKDYKGYMAFPISDFVSWDSSDLPFDTATQKVTGVYFYFDYDSGDYSDKAFYFDDIAFTSDYEVFVTEKTEDVSDETSAETSQTENSETPDTSDGSVFVYIIAAVSMLGFSTVVFTKRRVSK